MTSGSAKITSDSATPGWSATRECARSHGVGAPSGRSARNHCGEESSPNAPAVPGGVSYRGSRFTRDSAARSAFDGRSLTRTRLVPAAACLSFGTRCSNPGNRFSKYTPPMERLEAHRSFFANLVTASAGLRGPGSSRLVAALASTPRERFVGPGPWRVFTAAGYVETPTDDPA